MKLNYAFITLIIAIFTTTVSFAETGLSNDKEKFSYAVGTTLGGQLKQRFQQQADDIDQDIMLKGLADAFRGGKLKMTPEEVRAALQTADEKRKLAQQKNADEALAKGNAWLATHKSEAGVTVTASGLQYKVITEGTGKQPTADDTVEVHYKGTLIDGTEFDSSYKRGQPATFPVKGVIKGWTEALQLMKEGGKLELAIPSDLAYGKRGAGANIPPNSALLFEVELLKVK